MNRKATFRTVALAGVSAFALGIAGAAAQTVTDYEYGIGDADPTTFEIPVGTYTLFGENNQQLDAPVAADVVDGSITVTGPNDGANVTVTSNAFTATAVGNVASTAAIDDTNQDEEWGLRILSSQIASPDAVVSAEAAQVETGADLTAFEIGNVTVNDNDIIAGATVNDAANVLEGMPSTDDAPQAGSVTGDFTAGVASFTIDNAHSSIGNAQFTANAGTAAGSGALVTEGRIFIDNDAPGTTLGGTFSLGGNEIAASYAGNVAGNTVLDPDGVDYSGSVIIVNAQANVEQGAVPDASALVFGSEIMATIVTDSLTGVLSVSDNRIGADSAGNVVTNRMVFAEGISVTGENDEASSAMSDDGATFAAEMTADLGIATAQGNINTTFRSAVVFAAVGVDLDADLERGTVSVGGNAIEAAAVGNQSDSVIAADGPVFSATAAIGGFQVNDGTVVSAEIFGAGVGAIVAGDLSDGAVLSVGENAIGAMATGNVSDSAIAIDAENLSVGGGLASVDTDAATDFGSVSAQGGAVVTNLQSNYGGDGVVSASVGGTSIGLLADSVTGSTVAVDDNAISAAATGNAGSTLVQLTGVDGQASAGVGNVQISDTEVGAALFDVEVAMGIGDVADATVSLSGNDLTAMAVGNTGSNTVRATGFSTLTLGDETAGYDGAVGDSSADAALAVVSNQEFRQNVTAFVTEGSQIVVDSGNVSDSVVAINDNTMLAAATGNNVANTLRIDAVSLEAAEPGEADLFGAVVNLQTNAGGADVIADVNGTGPGGEIGLGMDAATDSTVSVSGNSAVAAADGSFAVNRLVVTGTTHAAASTGADDEFSFILQSTQVAGGDSLISATVFDIGVGVSGDEATDSTLAISGNDLIAQARSNVAINTVNLGVNGDDGGFSDLQTSALLDNTQTSEAAVNASVDLGRIGLELNQSSGSSLTVSNNNMAALAAGNASENRMNVAAVNLQGGANDDMRADFLVLNSQSNSGPITASVTQGQIGINEEGAGQTIVGGSANVLNNGASARAFGNSSDNRLTMASVSAGGVTGGVSNTQVNSGPVSASVTDTHVGIFTAAGTSVNATVSGNRITASATGNSAVNVVRRTNY